MKFIGPIDVEELEPGPEVRLAFLAQGPSVEVVFGAAVGVQRFEVVHDVVAVDIALGAVAVGRRRTGVNQGQAKLHTQVPNGFGVVEVEPIKQRLVLLGGVRSGPEVEHELHLTFIGAEPVWEVGPVHLGGDREVFVVALFGLHREVVDQHKLAVVRLQKPDGEHTADEACSSCYHNHGAKVLHGNIRYL